MLCQYNYNFNFFFEPSEELSYFLGFVAADGYVYDGGVQLFLNQRDITILEHYRNIIVPEKPLQEDKKHNAVGLCLHNKMLGFLMKKWYGLTDNKKALSLRFPNETQISWNLMRHFVRGYIDGDGCIDTTKGYKGNKVYIGPRLRILGNETFLKDMNEEIRNFVKHKTNSIAKKGNENVYCITYNFSTAHAILDWIYKQSNVYLLRKYQKYKEVCNCKTR